MSEKRNEYLAKLTGSIHNWFQEIKSRSDRNYQIESVDDMIINIVLHNYLDILVVFENQEEECYIEFGHKKVHYTHIHMENYEALNYLKKILHDEIVFLEPYLFYILFWPMCFRTISIEKYKKIKDRLHKRKALKIYSASQVFQGKPKGISR